MKRVRWLWVLAVVIFVLGAHPARVWAAEGDNAAAKTAKLGKNVSSQLTEAYPERHFTFTLPSSGRTVLHATSYAERTNYRIYDPAGNVVWKKESVKKNTATGKSRIDETIDLKGGTYTLYVDSKYLLINRYYGKFVFRINYSSVKETFAETGKSEVTELSKAPAVSLNKTVYGQIAANEDQDIFRFRLSSDGIVTFKANAAMRYLWYNLYDADGAQIFAKHAVWNAGSGRSSLNLALGLRAGTYYLAAAKDRSTGSYAFRLSFKKVAVSFPETGGSDNDSAENASKIQTGKTFYGLIALNNEADHYTFTLKSAKKLRLQAAAYTKYISYKILNSRGETVWSSTPRQSSASGKSRIDEPVSLAKGTYCFVVKRIGDNTGRYLFRFF